METWLFILPTRKRNSEIKIRKCMGNYWCNWMDAPERIRMDAGEELMAILYI